MSGSINKVILVGNLGRDPETRMTQDGGKIVNLSIATSENWKDRTTGERRDRTEWHRVVIFNERLSEVAERYLKKGSKVYLEGQLQTRKWTDQSGVEKYTTEVVLSKFRGELTMLDSRGGGEGFAPGPDSGSFAGSGKAATDVSGSPANFGGSGSSGPVAAAASQSSGTSAPSSTNDFDDDIPF
ncbi:MAG: single-stranded DNA-binding protein [Alphaproteobacteria bacterium]|jgi:single-strand DNA-binding protein|nr:single-stranded DNA-binding protein [Alphaproteobacteria bacterium]MBT5390037.1 single-stranded DNA-binding protein [Alphaproteobacteria bacterium]MBT5540667.1 single-stranded DNA-binding protein [Alphaproteobacteria bacterium]MBT5654580.1 single-stranded DNA-binding protein [Alphaproteobacteria bacterium]